MKCLSLFNRPSVIQALLQTVLQSSPFPTKSVKLSNVYQQLKLALN